MKIASKLMATAGIIAGVSTPALALAASQSLPWQDSVGDIAVQVSSYCSSNGLNFRDRSNNGIDAAGLAVVDGVVIGTGATSVDLVTVGSDSSLTHSETAGDLEVEVNYRVTTDNVVRTLVSITNTGSSDLVDVPVSLISVFGDSFKLYHVDGGSWRSSGDWFVTTELPRTSPATGYYSEVFHVADGSGSPESVASIADCSGNSLDLDTVSFGDIMYGYLVDIPAGQTRRILTFQGVTMSGATHADAVAASVAKATALAPNSLSPGSGILSDLSEEDACTVVNWDFSVCGGDNGGGSYDFDDIDIEHYMRSESDLPDTK